MNTASKLALLCALALAAIAAASASALASNTTTVTPTGAWQATTPTDRPGQLDNNVLTVTCAESNAAGTIDNNTTPSRATITTLTFIDCTDGLETCTVVINTLPASLNVKHVLTSTGTAGSTPNTTGTTATAVATLVDTETATIECGSVTCNASADTTLHLEGHNTVGATPASLHVIAQPVTLTLTCGASGTWDHVWTINSTGGGTDTTLTVEV